MLAENYSTALGDALAALAAGEAIVYPTETFYALGVDAVLSRKRSSGCSRSRAASPASRSR